MTQPNLNELKLQDLNKDTDVELLMKHLDSLFKRDKLSEVYERYTKFDRHEKKDQDKMEDFILEFEKLYNRIKKNRWNYLKLCSLLSY